MVTARALFQFFFFGGRGGGGGRGGEGELWRSEHTYTSYHRLCSPAWVHLPGFKPYIERRRENS